MAHFLGEYNTIGDVYKLFPSGGVAGDYIVIDDEVIYWDDALRIWGEKTAIDPSTDIENNIIDGGLTIEKNLTVKGETTLQDMVADTISCNNISIANNPFALKEHYHDSRYSLLTHNHSLSELSDLTKYLESNNSATMIYIWSALAQNGSEQIDVSHLVDAMARIEGQFISKQSDDEANGNIVFNKAIEVAMSSLFKGGIVASSTGNKVDIYGAVIEEESDSDSDDEITYGIAEI